MNALRISRSVVVALCFIAVAGLACKRQYSPLKSVAPIPPHALAQPLANAPPQVKLIVDGAIEQTKVTTGYDASYVGIKYPGGDVPIETGVCSDVVVRAFRKTGIDLQQQVHEDMQSAWSAYPRKWASNSPDANIDHRRVLNLMTYFERRGKALPVTSVRADYLPGDVVAWDLGGGMDHIGIVSNLTADPDKHLLIIHNIGAGARAEDVLLAWTIKGHYRYFRWLGFS